MEKAELASLLQRKTGAKKYLKEMVIFQEGDQPTDGLILVLTGTVRIEKRHDGHSVVLGKVQAGEIFGEAALLLKTPRGADAIADSAEVILLYFDKKAFLEEARANPKLIRSLLMLTIGRVEGVMEKLLDLKVPIQLFISPELGGVIHEFRKKNQLMPSLLNNTRPPLFKAGHQFFHQGELNSGEVFLVLEGGVKAIWESAGQKSDIFSFEPGDFFGYSRPQSMPLRAYHAVATGEQNRVVGFRFETMERLLTLDLDHFFSFFGSVLAVLIALNEGLKAVETGTAFDHVPPSLPAAPEGFRDRSMPFPHRSELPPDRVGSGVHRPAKTTTGP